VYARGAASRIVRSGTVGRVRLSPLALLQLVNGAIWAFLGAVNVAAIAVQGGAPALGWWQAIAVAIVVAALLAVVSARAVRRALDDAQPAAGVPLAAPSQTVGRCIGPAAAAVAILVALSVLPGGEPYRCLAALLFLAFGVSYGPLALWVRRFEEQQGVIVAQPVNRLGVRSGPIRVLRLPR
jgi:hypothetical protein